MAQGVCRDGWALGIMARKEKCYSMATHSVNLGDIIIGANEAKIPF